MNTEPLVTATPSRWISGLNHNGHRGRYRRVAPMETIPSYESLAAVMRVLEDIQKPQLWAREKLKAMTGCGANWKAMESEPPNETAERAAVSVLRKAYTLRP